MTQAPAHELMAATTPNNSLWGLLNNAVTKTLFLAFMVAMVFLPGHTINMILSEAFVLDIEVQEQWSSGGNAQRRIAFLSCAAIGMLSLLLGRGTRFRVNLPVILIGLYVLWTGASFLWSIDRPATVRRYILLLCCVIGCFGFCRFVRVRDVVLAAVILTIGLLMLGVGCEIFFGKFVPHRGSYRFAGTVHPNIQAATLAIGCIASYTMARVEPKWKLLFFGIFSFLFVFLVLTKCRSATLSVPVCLGIIWLAAQSSNKVFVGTFIGFWLISTAVMLCQVTGFDPIAEYEEILLLGRKEETGESLTGRLPLWEDLMDYISVQPIQGYGFGAFWTPRHINDIAGSQQWVISEAHSSYFDCTLQLGVVGCFLMASTAVTTLFYSAITFRRTMKPEYLFLVGGVAFCIVRGFTESRINDPATCSTFLFMALAAHSWVPNSKSLDSQTSGISATSGAPTISDDDSPASVK